MGGTLSVGQTRVEIGFIGARADIRGGFANQTNELRLVTLNWMIEQASDAGVNMNDPRSVMGAFTIIHVKSDNQITVGTVH